MRGPVKPTVVHIMLCQRELEIGISKEKEKKLVRMLLGRGFDVIFNPRYEHEGNSC